MYALDLTTGKLRESALVTTADYDFTGKLIMSHDKLLGFRVTTDAQSTMWFDPAMKALQEAIDSRLDNTVNMIAVLPRAESPWVLVESYSDVRPTSFLVYNTELVGDPVKDAAQLTASSPLAQAARIKQPLMLAYGGAD